MIFFDKKYVEHPLGVAVSLPADALVAACLECGGDVRMHRNSRARCTECHAPYEVSLIARLELLKQVSSPE